LSQQILEPDQIDALARARVLVQYMQGAALRVRNAGVLVKQLPEGRLAVRVGAGSQPTQKALDQPLCGFVRWHHVRKVSGARFDIGALIEWLP